MDFKAAVDHQAVAAAGHAAAQTVQIHMAEYRFDPAVVRVSSGHTVQVEVVNDGGVAHDWTLIGSDFQLPVHLAPGERASVTFTLTKPGTYCVVCTEPGHEQAGMAGQLVVE